MKGNAKVLELLSEALSEELTAINQYFLHSELCESWGYEHLQEQIRRESIDEMKHAEKLIERILFLEGHPDMIKYGPLKIGSKVEEILANDLALEIGAISLYNRGVGICAEAGDNGTRDLLQGILLDEERHLDWIETQIGLVKELGLANYLSRQIPASHS